MICFIIFFDLDHEICMIWIKKLVILFWSGSEKRRIFFDLDQKTYKIFLIWTKKESIFFWSGPKIEDIFFDLDKKFVFFFFDLDQKIEIWFLIWIKKTLFFLIWIKKSVFSLWSRIKKYSNLDQRSLKIMRSKNDPLFWSMTTNREKL